MIAIVGCPRSGTSFMMRSFRDSGYTTAGEEWDGKTNPQVVVGWPHITKLDLFQKNQLYHLVRFPLDTISSMQTMALGSWVMLREALSFERSPNVFVEAARCWVAFTDKMDEYSSMVVPIELSDMFLRSCQVIPHENRRLNTRANRYEQRSWDEMKDLDQATYQRVVEKAEKYGYHV